MDTLDKKYLIALNIITSYFIIMTVLMEIFFINIVGIKALIYATLPFMFSILVGIFYLFSAVKFLFNPGKAVYKNLLLISLFLFSVRFRFCGLSFNNMIGPLAEIGIMKTENARFFLTYKMFVSYVSNGFSNKYSEAYFLVNLFNLTIFFLAWFFWDKAFLHSDK